MITFETWADVREALTEAKDKGLILSFRNIPARGLVVIGADMEETGLTCLSQAERFLAGLASAECAYRDGKAKL